MPVSVTAVPTTVALREAVCLCRAIEGRSLSRGPRHFGKHFPDVRGPHEGIGVTLNEVSREFQSPGHRRLPRAGVIVSPRRPACGVPDVSTRTPPRRSSAWNAARALPCVARNAEPSCPRAPGSVSSAGSALPRARPHRSRPPPTPCRPPRRRRPRPPADAGQRLRTYTPRHLSEKILKARSALEGERRQVTILFADIAGYTSLAERLDPEEVHQLIDRAAASPRQAAHLTISWKGAFNSVRVPLAIRPRVYRCRVSIAKTSPRLHPGSCSQRAPKSHKADNARSVDSRGVLCGASAPVLI